MKRWRRKYWITCVSYILCDAMSVFAITDYAARNLFVTTGLVYCILDFRKILNVPRQNSE